MIRVVLIDGQALSEPTVVATLEARGHVVRTVDRGAVGTAPAHEGDDVLVAAIIVDDPVEAVRRFRAATRAAIIAVAGDTDFLTLVELYDAGVDDCLPVSATADQVVASVEAVVTSRLAAPPDPPAGSAAPDDTSQARGTRCPPLELLPIERRILAAQSAGAPASRRQLVSAVWGPGRDENESVLRLYLGLLRRKFAGEPISRFDPVTDRDESRVTH